MSLLFVNNSAETFTPTQSGALATIIYECCRVARQGGAEPVVITRRCEAEPFRWNQTIFIDPPRVPKDHIGVLLCRAERKIGGWRYLRQREYAQRVVRTIRQKALSNRTIILFNDPETAVILRSAFPKASILHWFQNQQQCKEKFRLRFAGAANVVLGVSNFTSRWVENYYGLPPGSVRTLYNGVDVEQFHPTASPPAGHPVVNFVGRTGVEKGADLLLRAALKISERNAAFSLQLIGSNHWDRFELDDYQKELLALGGELESRGVRVRRTGHVGRPQLPAEIRKAHLHVVPARWDEPFGMTTIEGMACGLATIASRTGGTPEVVGNNGWMFERDSITELAEAIQMFLSDRELLRGFAAKARTRAREFTWDRAWRELTSAAGD
ncbi:MAG TPA: glycosyltransferase family 4 protein [Tepidisphaeraceae bacterium]|jgi:glycosyltransferase involved in cell wall biosynthesis|nr:glycosyltransferase family 4 protein [Tepidisphaeraceae bacterium]